MPRVVLTAEVDAPAKWEEAFRSHGDLFQELWGDRPVPEFHFTTTDTSEVVLYFEVEDLDHYFAIQERPELADAMENDGVNRETVKIYVLDKTASF